MRNKMSARVSNCFQFMIAASLIIFSPFAGQAQNNSAVNVVGIDWRTISSVVNLDNSVTITTRYYYFFEQGKVRCITVIGKTAGGTNQMVSRQVYNPRTGYYETQMVLEFVPTSGSTSSSTDYGTYKIKGKSISVYFPAYTISATIYNDLMKGTLTDKNSNAEEEWLIGRASQENSTNQEPQSEANNDSINKKSSDGSRKNVRLDSNEKPQPNAIMTSALLTVYDKELVLVDGKLRPAKGYRWVNPNDPEDFKVERIP